MTPGRDPRRQDLVRIFTAAVEAVDPAALVRAHLEQHELREMPRRGASPDHVLVVGAGKAAARMAQGSEAALGPGQVRGLVIVPDGCAAPLRAIDVAVGRHPLPDRRGVRATTRLCQLVAAHEGPLLFLLSGGASSLLVRPRRGLSLSDKVKTSHALIRSTATIDEINTVRKHLSLVKGGGLLRITSARPLVSLILSDVVGDDPGTIGSGPTTPDSTTFADAEAVLRRTGLVDQVPGPVLDLLERGVHGDEPETVKPGDPETVGCRTWLIGANRDALAGARREAGRLGYRALVTEQPLVGDTRHAAREWIRLVQREVAARPGEPCCVISGGETTVEVTGSGRGGRNSEFALALAEPLAGSALMVLSAGSDGIDGPTDAAGAFVSGDTLARARARALDAEAMLENNDSYSFFAALDDLFRCGPTGTNVMDVKLATYLPPDSGAC